MGQNLCRTRISGNVKLQILMNCDFALQSSDLTDWVK